MLAQGRKVLVVGKVREMKLGRMLLCCLLEKSRPTILTDSIPE
jgi:hypothetical protein